MQRVRSLMVQQPYISIEGMRRHLAAQNLPLDRHYIASLVKLIQAERIKRAETWTLNVALASFQDAIAEIARVGWEIENDQIAEGRDRAAALREIREVCLSVRRNARETPSLFSWKGPCQPRLNGPGFLPSLVLSPRNQMLLLRDRSFGLGPEY
jgi:hypothetical protein